MFFLVSEKPRVPVSQWAENRRKAAEAAEAEKQRQKEEELERRKDLLPKARATGTLNPPTPPTPPPPHSHPPLTPPTPPTP